MVITSFETAKRRVDVWVPSDGHTGPRPVLVMHDGGNLFDDATAAFGVSWRIPEAIQACADLGPQPVVIGAWNTGVTRAAEYAPERVIRQNPNEAYQFVGVQVTEPLSGDDYQRELALEILPRVAEITALDLRPTHVAIAGSSMGGLASLYGMALYPEIYGTALCLSTHWAMSTEKFACDLVAMLPDADRGNRVWLDHGTDGLDAEYGPTQAVVDIA